MHGNIQYYYSTTMFKSQIQNSRKGLKVQNADLNLDFRTSPPLLVRRHSAHHLITVAHTN